MTEKLKRITSDADMHKVLDVSYLSAFAMGLVQAATAIVVVNSGLGTLGTQLLMLQMVLFCIFGMLAYIFHIKGQVYWEQGMIPGVVIGMAMVMVGHTMAGFAAIKVEDPFYITMSGLAIGIGAWFEMEMIGRFYKIRARRLQLTLSRKARAEADTPISVSAVQHRINEATTTL